MNFLHFPGSFHFKAKFVGSETVLNFVSCKVIPKTEFGVTDVKVRTYAAIFKLAMHLLLSYN